MSVIVLFVDNFALLTITVVTFFNHNLHLPLSKVSVTDDFSVSTSSYFGGRSLLLDITVADISIGSPFMLDAISVKYMQK